MAVVLVTGGAGYVGSHACKLLHRAGHLPVAYDDFSTGRRGMVRYGPLVEGAMEDAAILDAAFRKHRPDAVMHFAALTLVGESIEVPEMYWSRNVAGAASLAALMREHGVDRLVHSSTCAVFGMPDVALVDEETPRRPINPYGASKRAVEDLFADCERAFGLRSVALRYFNVAGADPEGEIGEANDRATRLIPLVLEAAAGESEGIAVFGEDYPTPDGTCIRDYVHVVDVARAHVLSLDHLLAGGPSDRINIGSGTGSSVREVIDTAEQVTGRPVAVSSAPRRAGDPARLVSDHARATHVLGWKPERPKLGDMIADAWNWRLAAG